MTRGEEIIIQSYDYGKYLLDTGFSTEEAALKCMRVAFIDGARWADAYPHWISVEDEMPKDGQHTATINKAGVQDVRHYSHGKWYSNFGNEYDDITHWMPLPQAPKEGE